MFNGGIASLLSSLLLLSTSLWQPTCCGQQVNATSATLEPGVDSLHTVVTVVTLVSDDKTTRIDHVSSLEGAVVVKDQVICKLSTTDSFIHSVVKRLVKENSLIEYRLNFTHYKVNPLITSDVIDAHRADRWARVTTSHGQTIRSLAFNYGVLSLFTLTLGTEILNVELVDSPTGCFGKVLQNEKITAVQHLLMRDFAANGSLETVNNARVCHEVILDDNGYAQFRHNCCYVNTDNNQVECTTEIGNIYLELLHVMLAMVRFGLPFFCPAFFSGVIIGMSEEEMPYVVKLKESVTKTVWFGEIRPKNDSESFNSKNTPDQSHTNDCKIPSGKNTLDLSNATAVDFPKLREQLKKTKCNGVVKVTFNQCDILVDYKRTLKENTVPVSLLQTLFRTLIKCHIRYIGPFKKCCNQRIFQTSLHGGNDKKTTGVTWSTLCRQFPKLLLVLLIPLPFYIRVWVFYGFESVEVHARKNALVARGLRERFDTSFVHYFTPSHVLFLCVYSIYAVTFVVVVILDVIKQPGESNQLKSIIVTSFKDFKNLRLSDVLKMAVSNFVWPLSHLGVCGCVVGLILYWPIVLPFTAVVCIVYLLPTLYIGLRMILNAKTAIIVKERRSKKYQVQNRYNKRTCKLDIDQCGHDDDNGSDSQQMRADECIVDYDDVDYIEIIVPASTYERSTDDDGKKSETPTTRGEAAKNKKAEDSRSTSNYENKKDNASLKSEVIKCDGRRVVVNALSAIIGILALLSSVIVLSEVTSFLVEVATFTIMGIIVNAGTLLRYVTLLLMILVYCCDCFNNVSKKYLKMSKALFEVVESRIKNLEQETNKPSQQQQNQGFQAKAIYGMSDDISDRVPRHWFINDLVLFVDNENEPRIPRKLFEQVCNIRAEGVPGPIHLGLLNAVKHLIKILFFVCFVFVIVLSFGLIYNVSSANQMLVTLLLGFLPMVIRTVIAPPDPDVDLGSITFKNKMGEVITNFWQFWPVYDLPFEPVIEEITQNSADKTASGVETETQFIESADRIPADKYANGTLNATQQINHDVDLLIFLPPNFFSEDDKKVSCIDEDQAHAALLLSDNTADSVQ